MKPVLLTLYESYFLPLGEALNPILTGFLIGLFSALEEGADYYNRVILLLDNLANRIDEFYFYTCIWSAIHLVGSVRYSAITFIVNRFDKRKSIKDQFHLIGFSIETTVKQKKPNEKIVIEFFFTRYLLFVHVLMIVNNH